jgi:hypothetical protein
MTASARRSRRTTGLRPRSPVSATVGEPAADTAVADAASLAASPDAVEPSTSASPSGPANDESPLRSALSVLTTLGPPLTIATALMFYFGWARSDAQAHYMGLDVSLFGYSTQDYVLRSIKLLYIPLLVIAALALGWLSLHHHIVGALGRPSSRPALRAAGRTAVGIGLAVAIGGALAVTLNPALAPLVMPLVLAAGTATAAYGGWLAGAACDPDTERPTSPPWQGALRTLLVGSVITLALFWEVSNYAGVVGRSYALQISKSLQTSTSITAPPRATAFSATPLGIQAPGVHEERLNVDPGADKDQPRYRITGLRFLVRSGGRMFLLHDGWTPQRGTVIVVPDNDQVRWQFSR